MPYVKQTPVGGVWGVGRSWSEQLQHNGIKTTADLALSIIAGYANVIAWYYIPQQWN